MSYGNECKITVDRVKARINIDDLGDLQSKKGMSERIDRLYGPLIWFTAGPRYGRLQETGTGYQPLRGLRRLICWMNWMKYWQGSDSKRKVMSGGRQAIGSAASVVSHP